VLAALAVGADSALGFELPENTSYKLLFCAARRLVQEKLQGIPADWSRAEWTPRDIDAL
jgi:RsiW-degrading membrane proteinase PrsW (M82 family)